jgi:hypothetical protein
MFPLRTLLRPFQRPALSLPVSEPPPDPLPPVAGQPAFAPPPTAAIPRYPPFLDGLPAVPVAQLLTTQQALVDRLITTLGLTPEDTTRFLQPVLMRYAAWVHLLPASEAHHHRGAGGLLRHGLEVAVLAAQRTQTQIYGATEPPARRHALEPRWRLTAALAGLCHDLGKPCTHCGVVDASGALWNPWLAPLALWLRRNQSTHYFLHWRHAKPGDERYATSLVAHRVLARKTLSWLAAGGGGSPDLVHLLLMTLVDPAAAGELGELVIAADRASVEADLRAGSARAAQTALGVTVEQHLLDAARRLWRQGRWTVNQSGARLWVLSDGLYIVWRPAARDLIDRLSADGIVGIPCDPDTLADLLIERGLALPRDTDAGRHRYWLIEPTLTKGSHLHTLRLDPHLLFETPPAPAAATIHDPPASAAAPASVPVAEPAPVVPTPPPAPPADPEPRSAVQAVRADFVRRLYEAHRAGTLPFPVETQANGLLVPFTPVLNWYRSLPGTLAAGLDATALTRALNDPQPASGGPAIDLITRHRPQPTLAIIFPPGVEPL